MNRTSHKLVSILLALVSIFGIVAGSLGIRDALAVKDYLTSGEDDPVAILTDGISQLKENEKTYNDGIKQYKDGVAQLDDAAAQLADGAAQIADGKAQLADAGKQLADGRKQIAAGEKELAANTAAYKEGKATLAKIDPIIPYLNQYIAFRDGTIAKLPGFKTAQEWFVKLVRPIMKKLGLFNIPNNVTDLPKYVTDMVKDGKAQIKQYEDGQKMLASAKKQLAAGEAQYADGKAQLADAERQFADGKGQYADGQKQLKDARKQLGEYEDGMVQIADGLKQVLDQKSFAYKDGTVVVASPAETLGKDYDFYKKDKDGKNVELLNGKNYVDLNKATEVRDTLSDFVDKSTETATKEIVSRIIQSALLILGSIAGLIAAIRGLTKTKGFVPGVIAAVAGLGALIYGIVSKFNDYLFLGENGTCNGKLQMIGIILFAIVALCFAIVTFFTRDKTKKIKVEGEDVPVAKD